jgi:hypothetical protein
MSRQSPNFAPSKRKATIDIEKAYLELQRLRDLVRQAELRQDTQRLSTGTGSNDHSAKRPWTESGSRKSNAAKFATGEDVAHR